MIATSNPDIKTCGFSDILFTNKLSKTITLDEVQISLRSNITRHQANKTVKMFLRTF